MPRLIVVRLTYWMLPLKKFLKFPQHSKPPLVRPRKCQSFVQKLRGTLFPEGNQLSVNWVL